MSLADKCIVVRSFVCGDRRKPIAFILNSIFWNIEKSDFTAIAVPT